MAAERVSPLIESIRLRGFLSFAPDAAPISLTGLNVIIGPNGSGKSNFIEAISVLRAVPMDLTLPIRQGGGVREWLWKGLDAAAQATIEVLVTGVAVSDRTAGPLVRHSLTFGAQGDSFVVIDERIESYSTATGADESRLYFGYEDGRPILSVQKEKVEGAGIVDRLLGRRELSREEIDPAQSVLSQRRDPDSYPDLNPGPCPSGPDPLS